MDYTDAMESILERTYRLLEKTDLSYLEIAEKTGLTKSWVAKFAQGAIDDPGVNKVELVHNLLIGRECPRAPSRSRRRPAAVA
jgi:transcriptional regulator with XRE-family HTH domain